MADWTSLPQLLADRGWMAAAALAAVVWRKHEARVDAIASKVSSAADRAELVRVHDRLDTLQKQVSDNHSEVLGHLIGITHRTGATPAPVHQPPPEGLPFQ